MKKHLLLLSAILITEVAIGQTNITTTKGSDFWVMFLYNHNYNYGTHTEEQRLYILGDQTTTVNISNNTSGTTTATLTSPSFYTMRICGTSQSQVATVLNSGYHVTSSEPVWVYADNYIDNNQDAAVILPTEALDTHYIVQDYSSTNDRGAEVGLLATEDNTVITMTVPCNVLGTSITSGTTLNITLNSGQTYMLMAVANGSFSGMEVTSNGKPFAMFVAGQNTAVPTSGSGRDFTYEQAVPVNQWGTEFIVGSTTRQSVNRLRITSSADNCMVYHQNGTLLAGPLQRGETWESPIPSPENYWHFTATSPIQVILYLGSYQTAGNIGDPSSITIPPINKGLSDYYFPFIESPNIQSNSHYVHIICHQDYDAGLTLDNGPLPYNETVGTIDNYIWHRIPLSNNTRHRLQNNLGPFIAYAYGLGSWESYGFTLGFAIDTIPTPEPVDIYDTICQGQCYDTLGLTLQPVHTQTIGNLLYERTYQGVHYVFHLTVLPTTIADIYDSIAVGDTLLWNDLEITSFGDYCLTLTSANGCDSVVTLHISYIGSTVDVYDTLCYGETYYGDVFLLNAVTADTVLYRDTIENEVPKRYVVHLHVLPTSLTQLNFTIIMGDTIGVCDTLLSVAGDYTFHYTNVHGCDSTVEVHLDYEAISLSASKYGICPGEEVTLTATGVHTYIWSSNPYDSELDAQQGMNPVTVHTMHTTVYSLLDEAGNIVATVTIGTDAAPTLCVEVNRDILDFDNPTLLFTDCSAGRYTTRWLFADGRQFTGERVRRRFNYPLPDSAIVTMTSCNRYNCCADTTIAIPMKINSVWFPNAFMPGADDNNLFQCFTSMDVAIFELVVYNRWGLLIWSSEDVNQGWDGRRTDGTPCPQGAYAYRYYLKATDGTVRTGTGTVTLLR